MCKDYIGFSDDVLPECENVAEQFLRLANKIDQTDKLCDDAKVHVAGDLKRIIREFHIFCDKIHATRQIHEMSEMIEKKIEASRN